MLIGGALPARTGPIPFSAFPAVAALSDQSLK